MSWGQSRRPRIKYGTISYPNPKEGSDGDIQINQTNLGAHLFGKIGGSWYGAPLTGTAGNPVTRIGTKLENHLAIDMDSLDIYKNSLKIASFGATTTIGDTATEHVVITSSSLKMKDGSTVMTKFASGSISMTGKIILTGAGSANVVIGVNNVDAGDNNVVLGYTAGESLRQYSSDRKSVV